jgi:pimeloyl-ACP methyl ester carboxylesterase
MSHQPNSNRNANTFEPVDPLWIIKALGVTFAIALVLAYVTLCTVFWFHQWQLVLHPSRDVPATPAALSLPFTEVHFAAANSGEPQLYGWWVPSDTPEATSLTALVLRDGDGSLSKTLPIIRDLHAAHLNVFVFDYRGYGLSAGQHPTQDSMRHDAESATVYLGLTRSIRLNTVVLYGTGVGASLAVNLCKTIQPANPFPAIILESPNGDLADTAAADIRSHIIPVHLLFHEDFPLAKPLATLTTPKLLISYAIPNEPTPPAFLHAADPKMTVELPISPAASVALHDTLLRFLDSYTIQQPTNLH